MEEKETLYEEAVDAGSSVNKKPKSTLGGSAFVKFLVFILLIVTVVTGSASFVASFYAADKDMYTTSYHDLLCRELGEDADMIMDVVSSFLNRGEYDSAVAYLRTINAEVAILAEEDKYVPNDSRFLWQSYDKTAPTGFYSTIYIDRVALWVHDPAMPMSGYKLARVFFDPEFVQNDSTREHIYYFRLLYEYRYVSLAVLAVSIVLFLFSFIFLLRSAGHRNGRAGIVPSLVTGLPFDVVTCGLIVGWIACIAVIDELDHMLYGVAEMALIIAALLGFGILSMLYLMDLAIRIKLGKWWRNTLIYKFCKWLSDRTKAIIGSAAEMAKNLPDLLIVIGLLAIVALVELFCIMAIESGMEFMYAFWMVVKLVELLEVMYLVRLWSRLKKGAKELASGNENYRIDTNGMYLDIKAHAQHLNSIGAGITKAVEARMKSERMKTELITNVSHDIKTPLTSIINYADLINQEPTDNPKITEYAEVLERQSKRMKKLLEDLLEASKATTGTLEIEKVPCEVDVLLVQAVGEYQQRMEEKGLDLHVNGLTESVKVLGDGRRLWRIFDNLLNNIYKYAQENSRVYLNLEKKDGQVFITFRNMSKYMLETSAEELAERFARGDKSRHEEGNGLGLSIAKNLTELQNGTFDIVLDGDLFKVVVSFPVLNE
ncbi:MAG: HAMP domain-containing histidine kinase [Acetatifactor sp.]|nr:HAMP domain-containing histidine kinase [Acetatifactor sp.]